MFICHKHAITHIFISEALKLLFGIQWLWHKICHIIFACRSIVNNKRNKLTSSLLSSSRKTVVRYIVKLSGELHSVSKSPKYLICFITLIYQVNELYYIILVICAFLQDPSFTLAPQGGVSSFDNSKGTWTYNLPVTASWEIDIFSRLRNGKLRNKALYYQSIEYRQAVRTQLIATTANLYFTLCMLDEQYAIANETASAWREAVDAIRAMKDAGMATEAAVAQNEAAYYSVETSVKQLAQSISETENSLCSLLAQTPHKIERGSLESQRMPADLLIGVPVQLLSRRPDVRRAEYSLMSAYYATAEARSALYPQITLSGTAGWTNSAGSQIVNPGKLLLSAAGQLLQPIFQAGANRARVKIAKAQQQEAMLAYEQTILNAGQEVNDALTACQTARESATLYDQQVASLRRAVESTELLMQHGSTTYLEVLTARQSLLSAQLQQVANRFTELQSVVTLYHALGGGRETETAQ